MTPDDTLSILTALTTIAVQAERIANALEARPMPAPEISKDLSEYWGFNWASIGAQVMQTDKHGAIVVNHAGKNYIRRNPDNKFGICIWYSRPVGKDETGKTTYEILIKFEEVKVEVDPLNPKTINKLRQLRGSSPASSG